VNLPRAGALLIAVVCLGGCAATGAAYKDGLKHFGATGRAIQPHLKPAANPSEEALYEAFDAALKEAESVK
jgi:Ni,Fe-hydrogenase III small subunit